MFKLTLICLVAAVIEAIQMVVIKKDFFCGKQDPNAVTWTAHRDDVPAFNYIPGRTTYDDKHGRYVADWRYKWEYRGKEHTIRVCDNPNSQYEHYMMESICLVCLYRFLQARLSSICSCSAQNMICEDIRGRTRCNYLEKRDEA